MKPAEKKTLGWALLFFLVLIAIFLKDFLFMRGTFLLGDYALQHFPWAEFYAKELKNFSLPLWTSGMHAGFPLVAEGQVGAFYPLNLILYFLFPFPWAHNINIILHFFLGAFFLYLYMRFLKVSVVGSMVSSVVWVFGSAYAGVEYNFVTMRGLIWLPLALVVIELLVREKRLMCSVWLGLIYFVQIVSGFLQFSFYSLVFSSLYFLVILIYQVTREKDVKSFLWPFCLYGVGGIIGVGLSAIQILPSLELSRQTLRFMEANLNFSLLGSFSPLAIFSLIFPAATGVLSGFRLYIGSLPLFFVILSLGLLTRGSLTRGSLTRESLTREFPLLVSDRKHRGYTILMAGFALLALLLSFGNPLYGFLVSLFKLYFFRVPAKLTLFVCFFLSILAGFGFEAFTERDKNPKTFFLSRKFFTLFVFVSIAIFTISHGVLERFGDFWIRMGRAYVDHFIYGQDFRRLSLEQYYQKVISIYDVLKASFSFSAYNVLTCFMLFVSLLAVYGFPKYLKSRCLERGLILCLVVVDLFIFSFYATGFRGNIASFDSSRHHELADYLKRDQGLYRVYLFAETSDEAQRLGLLPNQNMSFGLSYVGAYSPLITARLSSYLRDLGNIDDSLGYGLAQPKKFDKNLSLLSIANVKYIYSPKKLKNPRLKLLHQTKDKNFIYLNRDALSRAFFVTQSRIILSDRQILAHMKSPEFRPSQEIVLEKGGGDESQGGESQNEVRVTEYGNQRVVLYAQNKNPGWVYLGDLFYPGWRAFVDGKEVEIFRANYLFRAVRLDSGRHDVTFVYQPDSFRKGGMISGFTLCVVVAILIFSLKIVSFNFKQREK